MKNEEVKKMIDEEFEKLKKEIFEEYTKELVFILCQSLFNDRKNKSKNY